MSKKKNWADVDKRVRERYAPDAEELQDSLEKLPDLADQVETIVGEQPALGNRTEEEDVLQQADARDAFASVLN